jgi:hypothetical protein
MSLILPPLTLPSTMLAPDSVLDAGALSRMEDHLQYLAAQMVFRWMVELFQDVPELNSLLLAHPREWQKSGMGPMVELVADFGDTDMDHGIGPAWARVERVECQVVDLARSLSGDFHHHLDGMELWRSELASGLTALFDPVYGKGTAEGWRAEMDRLALQAALPSTARGPSAVPRSRI